MSPISNNISILKNLNEIEEVIRRFEDQVSSFCPDLDTKKFLEIAFSQILERRMRKENNIESDGSL